MSEYIGLAAIAVGLLFDLFGCIGLVRLPDVYTRLQAATKCVTLGTCMILVGVCIYAGLGPTGVKALVCMVFVLVTSPTAAHAIARGAYKSGVKLAEPVVVDRYAEVQPDQPGVE
jgi:multicomponent Na+:H+ antiporter subunit G